MASLQIPFGIWREQILLDVTCIKSCPSEDLLFFGLNSGRILKLHLDLPAKALSLRGIFLGHTSPIVAIYHTTFSGDQDDLKIIISLDEAGHLALWSTQDGRCLLYNSAAFEGRPSGMLVSPDEQFLIIYGDSNLIPILRLKTLEVVHVFGLSGVQWINRGVLCNFDDRPLIILISVLGNCFFGIFLDQLPLDTSNDEKKPSESVFSVKHDGLPDYGFQDFIYENRKFYISTDAMVWSAELELIENSFILKTSVAYECKDQDMMIKSLCIKNGKLIVQIACNNKPFCYKILSVENNEIAELVSDPRCITTANYLCLWDNDLFIRLEVAEWNVINVLVKCNTELVSFEVDLLQDVCGFTCTANFFDENEKAIVIAHGMRDGTIRISKLINAFCQVENSSDVVLAASEWPTPITCLCFLSDQNHLVSGDRGGTICLYDLKENKLVKHILTHRYPILFFCELNSDFLLYIDQAGYAFLIDIKSFSLLHTINPNEVIITDVFWTLDEVSSQDDSSVALHVCLFFENDRGVLWDCKTLKRLKEGPINTFDIARFKNHRKVPHESSYSISPINYMKFNDIISIQKFRLNDPVQVLLIDVRKLFELLINDGTDQNIVDLLLLLLSLFLPWGMDDNIDTAAITAGSHRPLHNVVPGIMGANGNVSFSSPTSKSRLKESSWNGSGVLSGTYLLSILSIFESISLSAPNDNFDQLRSIIVPKIISSLGKEFPNPTFSFMAKYWHDQNEQIRHSSRLIIVQTLDTLSPELLHKICVFWVERLPSNRSSQTQRMNRAAIILGIVAVYKPNVLDEVTLAHLAESLMTLIMDERKNLFLPAAIELIGMAFPILQNHLPALPIFRLLFNWWVGMSQVLDVNGMPQLRLSANKEDIAGLLDTVQLVREALVKLAAGATTILPQWLGHDFPNYKNFVEAWTTLTIISDLIKCRPHDVLIHLPLIAETLCKFVDICAASGSRTKGIKLLEPLLHDICAMYPMFARHEESNRLAAASGPRFVLCDLRGSSSKMLEGHTRPVTCLAFNNDCKMLMSYSMEEATLRWWNVPGVLGGLLGGNVKPFRTDVVNPLLTEAVLSSTLRHSLSIDDSLQEEGREKIPNVRIKWVEEAKIDFFVDNHLVLSMPKPFS